MGGFYRQEGRRKLLAKEKKKRDCSRQSLLLGGELEGVVMQMSSSSFRKDGEAHVTDDLIDD